jgi:hypothetical protein
MLLMSENDYDHSLKARLHGAHPDDRDDPEPDENPDLIGEALHEVDLEIAARLRGDPCSL